MVRNTMKGWSWSSAAGNSGSVTVVEEETTSLETIEVYTWRKRRA
jgi:hypothetical protein